MLTLTSCAQVVVGGATSTGLVLVQERSTKQAALDILIKAKIEESIPPESMSPDLTSQLSNRLVNNIFLYNALFTIYLLFSITLLSVKRLIKMFKDPPPLIV